MKRILSVLLVLAMLVSYVPTYAVAEETTVEDASAASADEVEKPEAETVADEVEPDETEATDATEVEAAPEATEQESQPQVVGCLVEFVCETADFTLQLYRVNEDNQLGEEVLPQEDGRYLLVSGKYFYHGENTTAQATEGYLEVVNEDELQVELVFEEDVDETSEYEVVGGTNLTCAQVTQAVNEYRRILEEWCNNHGKSAAYWNANIRGNNATQTLKNQADAGDYTSCLTNKPCVYTGEHKNANGCTSNSFNGAAQCLGFAKYMMYVIFREDGLCHHGELDHIPSDYHFAPGDVVWYRSRKSGYNHYRFIYDTDGTYVYYVAGNDNNPCEIVFGTMTWKQAREGYRADRVLDGVSISPATDADSYRGQYQPPVQTAPAAPTNFKAVYVDNARAKLSWSASSGATSYEVQYWSVGSNAWKTDTSYSSGTSYTSTGLKNYSSWTFRVRAVNSAGKSDWVSCNYEKTHTHSYKQEFEAAHPHKVYMKCTSCGDWYYTGATTTVDSCTQCHPPVQQVYLDLKGYLDGRDSDSLENFGTCDVYINDVKVADDCTDFYRVYPVGTKYSIKDIRATDGHKYIGEKPFVDEDGNTSIRFEDDDGTISGTLKKNTEVVLEFETTSHGGKCGDNLTWTLDGNGTLTISGSGAMSNFSAYQNVAPWLENWDKIARVVVEPGVTSIGGNAFQRCSSLSSVRIPESVTSIGDSAFSGCSGLTSITIPEGVASIGNSAFYGCSSMTSVTIPEAVTSIGNGAFWGCSSLTSVKIPESVTSIEGAAFRGCSSLSSITIPEGVESIGSYAFQGCSSLSSITIPEAVTSIEGSAFQGCSSLTSIMIPEGVESIGSYAFSGCSGLSEVHLSNSVSSIGEKAFDGCNNLADVFYSGTEQQWNSIQTSENNTCLTNARLHFNSAEVISGSCGKNLTWAITEDGVLKISGTGEMQDYEWCEDGETVYSSAPWGRMGITGLELGEGITRIGECAFLDCADISGDLILPRTLKQIGECAFSGCYGLTGVLNFPENLEEIESCAFQGCYGLYGTLQLPSKISYIGGAAFNGCSGFTGQLEIPMNVQRIDDWAFLDCSGLTNVSILGEVATIGNVSFGGCSSLESVSISEGTVNIGSCAFAECTALESIFIPKSVETIDESAFKVCDNLKNVNYGGAKTDWNQIQIAKGNTSLLNATIHYQIQSAPEIRPVDTAALDGGATLKLTLWSIDQNKQIGAAWSLAEGSEAYASITASGTLTAKAVIEPVEITVIAQPTNGEPTATKTIRITPKATALLLMRDGEVLGETLNADMYDLQALTLTAIKNTMEEAQGIHWSTSAKTVAQVDAKGLVTLLKPGTAVIQATDSGKLTGKVTLNVTYTDKSPRLEATTLNLNTALSGGVTVDFVEAYGNGVEALQWNDERFLFEYQENRLTVSAKDALKNGTYPVSLTAVCSDGRTYAYPLTLKVTNTLPKVTVKQTAKLNLFYRDSESTLTITGGEVESAAFIGNSDFALENEDGQWFIRYADPENIPAKPSTKATLSVLFAGYNTPVTKSVTIATVNTSPKLKLSPASSVLNTVLTEALEVRAQLAGTDNDNLSVWTDTPGAEVYLDDGTLTIELSAAKAVTVNVYVQSDSWAKPVKLTHKVSVTTKKPTLKAINSTLKLNSYFPSETASTGLILSQGNLALSMVELTPTAKAGAAAAESEKLSVSYDLDSEEIVAEILDSSIKNGTYSFTCVGTLEDGTAISGGTIKVSVTNTLPKAKLSASTVRLNKRLTGEEATVKVSLTGGNGYTVTGFENLPDFMWYEDGILTVTLPEQSGAYPLYATVSRGGEEAVLPTAVKLTVQVYDKVPSFRLSAKGKLDVLNPDSEIIYTPKLTNALGTATDVELTGAGADLFDAEVVNGTIHLTLAKSGDNYSTKATYKIVPLLTICDQQVKGPALSIKVTQSALKLSALPNRTVYTSQATPLVQTLRITAPAAAEIGDVTLNAKTSAALRSALNAAGGLQCRGATIAFPAKAFTGLMPGNYTVILDIVPVNAASDSKTTQAKFTLTVKK